MARDESTRARIVRFIEERGSVTGPELARHIGVTRQAISLHIRDLLAEGSIRKSGSTKAARYHPATSTTDCARFRRDLALKGLEEAAVYTEAAIMLNLSRLPGNVESIVHYAFTEMLNNAIDHSLAKRCNVDVELQPGTVRFLVRDRGIGVFRSIADKFGLDDEHAAMIELIKGKTTTMPEAHSGEGIFFVSKAADRFSLRSHRLQIEWNNDIEDVFVSEPRHIEGTEVRFEIMRDARRRLEDVFSEFAPEEFDHRFEKTRVLVRLLGKDYVSRSEAKRLMHHLDRFAEVELDMRDVNSVGQGFVDEIFRVFANANPGTRVRAVNTRQSVAAMIRHVGG